jgi:hypothetical protein
LLFPRTPESGAIAGRRATAVLDSLADIMQHGSNVVQALDLLLSATGSPGPDSGKSLKALFAASDDLRQARSAVEAIERTSAEHLPDNEKSMTVLFESGLIIFFNLVSKKMSFYRTNRIDFRTFHRNISKDQSASLKLIPLGESAAVKID